MAAQKTKPHIGRPPKIGGRDTQRQIRTSDQEWDTWQRAAELAGQTRSAWMRSILNRAARRTISNQPPN